MSGHPTDCPCASCADARASLLLDDPRPDPQALGRAVVVFAATLAFFAAFGAVLLTH